IKWVSLGAIPVLLLIGYVARSQPEEPEGPAEAPSSETKVSASGASDSHTASPLDESWPPKEAKPNPEARPNPELQPKQRAAVDLPTAAPPTPKRSHGSVKHRPSGPCGGLVVRAITHDDEDPTTSVAVDYDSPAEIKHVGETIGGYRVSKIEWDRVTFSSGGGVCSIAINPGVRESQAGSKGGALELAEGGENSRPAPEPNAPPQGVTGGGVPLEIAEGIRVDSPLSATLEGFTVKALKSRGKKLLKGVELSDAEDSDGHKGVKLSKIKRESLLERLRFLDGDILLSIDDQPITSKERLLEWLEAWLLEEPKEAHTYRVVVIRDGEIEGTRERVTLELSQGLIVGRLLFDSTASAG
ncbi:MAG: hypothetical protein KC492_37335, partial [Myxococcales bacterium]|nr:hypothetical protein [Myxococcales bacterium]